MAFRIRIGRFAFGSGSPPAPPGPPFTVPHPSFERTRLAMEAHGRRLSRDAQAFIASANREYDAAVDAGLGRPDRNRS